MGLEGSLRSEFSALPFESLTISAMTRGWLIALKALPSARDRIVISRSWRMKSKKGVLSGLAARVREIQSYGGKPSLVSR